MALPGCTPRWYSRLCALSFPWKPLHALMSYRTCLMTWALSLFSPQAEGVGVLQHGFTNCRQLR